MANMHDLENKRVELDKQLLTQIRAKYPSATKVCYISNIVEESARFIEQQRGTYPTDTPASIFILLNSGETTYYHGTTYAPLIKEYRKLYHTFLQHMGLRSTINNDHVLITGKWLQNA